MDPYVLAGAAVILAVGYVLFRRAGGPNIQSALDRAVEAEDIVSLVETIKKESAPRRSLLFQQSISFLWENWQRPLAVKLVKEFAREHSGEKICQYWLKQVLEVEPRVAGRELDKKFLEVHFRPDVASCCGKTSS